MTRAKGIAAAFLLAQFWPIAALANCPLANVSSTRYNGPYNSSDFANSVAIGSSGDIYVAGSITNSAGIEAWRVSRYDSSLRQLLSSTDYTAPSGGWASATSIKIDGSGNVFVAGNESGGGWRIQEYDPTLSILLGSTLYFGADGRALQPKNLSVDGSGNVVVAGSTTSAGGGLNWRVSIFDSMLTSLLSSTDYNGPGNGNDVAECIAIDGAGDVFVVGYEVTLAGSYNWRVRKYDSTLTTLLSTTEYASVTAGGPNLAFAVVADGAGNIVVGGYEWGSDGTTNWRINRYSTTLTSLLGSTDYISSMYDYVNDMAIDDVGNIVVVGRQDNLIGGSISLIRTYNPTLTTLVSTTSFQPSGTIGSSANGVAIAGNGNIVVAGDVKAFNLTADWWVQEYSSGVGLLAATLNFSSNPASIGQVFTATLTVTSTGCKPVISLLPQLDSSSGGGSAVLLSGPSPASTAYVGPGQSFTFTWTFSATAAGLVTFSGTVMGWDPALSATAMAASTGTVLIQMPAVLVIDSLSVAPGSAPSGSVFTATAVLRNAGAAGLTVTGLTRTTTAGSAGGLGAPGALTPGLPIAIAGGASVYIVWTYTGTAPCGLFGLLFSATGFEDPTDRAIATGPVSATPVVLTGTATGLTFAAPISQADALSRVALTARVTDSCGLGLGNTRVDFSMLDGGGYLSTMSGYTDAAGTIVVTLTLGPDQGMNDVQAAVQGTSMLATVAVLGINPLALKEPGAALDKNAINLGKGEVVLARIHTRTNDPVQVQIFTASGRLVRTLRNTTPMGRDQMIATWNGRTEDEFLVARGVYLVIVEGGGLNRTVLKVVVK